MNQLLAAEKRLTDMGYIPIREIHQPMGTVVGLQIYVPALLLSSTYDNVVRTLEDFDLKIWKNPNTETIYISEMNEADYVSKDAKTAREYLKSEGIKS